jgi:hypothetical protein
MDNDPLDAAIVRRLESTPQTWSDVELDETAVDEKALSLLIKAGMIEARWNVTVTAEGCPQAMIVSTVESGEPTEDEWHYKAVWQWLPQAWLDADGKTKSKVQCLREMVALRRTAEGDLAISAIQSGRPDVPLAYVRRLGKCADRGRTPGQIYVLSREYAAETTRPAVDDAGDQRAVAARPVKRNTTPGAADAAILSALCAHHQYRDGGCNNWEPIGGNQLAKLARVSGGAVTGFWKRRLKREDRDGTIEDYRIACANQTLNIKLAYWRDELPIGDVLQLAENLRRDDDD